jgi:hypothetical protein
MKVVPNLEEEMEEKFVGFEAFFFKESATY